MLDVVDQSHNLEVSTVLSRRQREGVYEIHDEYTPKFAKKVEGADIDVRLTEQCIRHKPTNQAFPQKMVYTDMTTPEKSYFEVQQLLPCEIYSLTKHRSNIKINWSHAHPT